MQDIKTRHQKRFFWDTLDDSFKVRTKDVPEGILLPANKFIVHRYKARSGHTSRAGILRVVAWMYLFKNYDLKDWVSFAEIYGLPLRLGKYAPGASDSDKAALMRASSRLAPTRRASSRMARASTSLPRRRPPAPTSMNGWLVTAMNRSPRQSSARR